MCKMLEEVSQRGPPSVAAGQQEPTHPRRDEVREEAAGGEQN